MPDIFLSYDREDQATARRFAEGFEREGLSVWWDATLRSGEAYDQVTEKALKEAKAVVVLWSCKSVDSRWVRAEATIADRRKTLVPVMIEPCDRPIMFELTQAADLSRWKGDANDPAWRAYVADVRRFVERGLDQSPGPPAATRYAKKRVDRRKGIAIALVALVGLASVLLFMRFRGGEPHAPARAPPVAGDPRARITDLPSATAASIAVLPFANLTGEPAKEYFSDGMAEELIDLLSKVSGLEVASRTSSFAYKGKNADIREIARELGVSTILEGSVRSAEARIRVTAQLIRADTGYNLWSQTYNREFKDLFELQDELAREIVTAFKTTLQADLPAFVSQGPPTKDLEAYEIFLRARAAGNRGTVAGYKEAVALYDQAVARDPAFAQAYLRRAGARASADSPLAPDVERDARRAATLDPELGPAVQATLGSIEAARGNWLGAADLIAPLVPGSREPGMHGQYATNVLWPTGQLRGALHEYSEALNLAPQGANLALNLARAHSAAGLDAEAIQYAKLAVALGSEATSRQTQSTYISADLRARRYGEAANRIIPLLPETVTKEGGAEAVKLVYAALAEPAKREAAIRGLRFIATLKAEDWVVKVWTMEWYALLDELDPAYELAQQLRQQFARQPLVGNWSWLWTPEMRRFRQDARFQPFVTQLGMMNYWKKYGPPDGCELAGGKLICD